MSMKLYGRPDVIERIKELRAKGTSLINVAFDIYDEYGIRLSPSTISYHTNERTRTMTLKRTARNYRKRKVL